MGSKGHGGALMPLEEAQRLTLEAAAALVAARVTEAKELPLWEARGHVLAEDVLADRDQPPFDRAAMDGYALRAADLTGPEAILEVIGEVPAGRVFEGEVGPGQAVAIMTGAPLPVGADAVQMVEKTSRDDDRVTVQGPLAPGTHVAPQGEDLRAGDVAVPAGRVISGLTLGALAAVGAARVKVLPRPRVAVVSSGSELVAVDEVPAPGQIRDSNRHTLMAMLEAARCRTADGGRVADTAEDLALSIREGLKSDVLVFSGGVSAGEYDLVAQALLDEGVELLFHKVGIKPGKPVLVGRHAGGLVFGLPGNPVSTFVTAQLLLLPALRTLGGRPDPGPWTVSATLSGHLPRTRARVTFHPGRLERAGDGYRVHAVAWNGSGDQIGFAGGNCLIRREIDAPEAHAGETVTVVLPRPPVG